MAQGQIGNQHGKRDLHKDKVGPDTLGQLGQEMVNHVWDKMEGNRIWHKEQSKNNNSDVVLCPETGAKRVQYNM